MCIRDSPKGVDPAQRTEQFAHPGAFLGQKAGMVAVGPPVFQVDFPVRDVPVAAEDDVAAAGAQRLERFDQAFQKVEFHRLPFGAGGAGGVALIHI